MRSNAPFDEIKNAASAPPPSVAANTSAAAGTQATRSMETRIQKHSRLHIRYRAYGTVRKYHPWTFSALLDQRRDFDCNRGDLLFPYLLRPPDSLSAWLLMYLRECRSQI